MSFALQLGDFVPRDRSAAKGPLGTGYYLSMITRRCTTVHTYVKVIYIHKVSSDRLSSNATFK